MPTAVPQTLESLTYEQLTELAAKVETQKTIKHRETETQRAQMSGMLDRMLATLQGAPAKAAAPIAQAAPAPAQPITSNGKHAAKAPKRRASPMKGKKAPIKYRHGKYTWTGRGKTPSWVETLEKSGRNRAEFAVA